MSFQIIPDRVSFFGEDIIFNKYEKHPMEELAEFVRSRRLRLNLTQEELAQMAGVGIRFVRDLEQLKKTLRCDKVNQVLALFGHTLGPVTVKADSHDK
jgi:y4mF family transcriptional regulator